MALLLLCRTCDSPMLRVSVLKQVSRKEIFRTFADEGSTGTLRTRVTRRHILKKQARTAPTNKLAGIHKIVSLLFSRACNASALQVKIFKHIPSVRKQIFRTCIDEKPTDALRTRVSSRRILKKQTIAPPTEKSAGIYKWTSLSTRAYNGLILRVKILNQIPRIQIFRTFADKLVALRTKVSCRSIRKEQTIVPPTDKSAGIYERTSLSTSAYNALILRVKILNQIPRIQIFRTFADKLDALRAKVSFGSIRKEQTIVPPTDKSAGIYERTSLSTRAYNALILRVKILNQIPRIQTFKTFADKLDALRTRISRKLILKKQIMASPISKVTEINNMVSLLFNKVSTVLMLRFKILQQISLEQIFRNFADKLNALRIRVSRIRPLKEQTMTSATHKQINKMTSSLYSKIYTDLALQLKVLKQVPHKQIFGTLTYESPISALRTSRHHRRTNTVKRPNMDKGSLVGSLGIATLFFYNFGLLNQLDNNETYVYVGCSIAVAVASAMATLHSPVIMNILTRRGFVTQLINLAAFTGAGVMTQNIEYNPGFGMKQMAWLLYASMVGIMFTPMLVGPLARRVVHTTGMFAGLYVIGKCAPKETLYNPINEALAIFMDIIHIFIRIVVMVARISNKSK